MQLMPLFTKMPPLLLFMKTLLKLHFIQKNPKILVITKRICPQYRSQSQRAPNPLHPQPRVRTTAQGVPRPRSQLSAFP